MNGGNFYNPYMYQTANMARNLGSSASISNGLNTGRMISGTNSLFSKFNFSNFLNGASKTLNVVNQAIPIFYQVKPMINNAKTMFKIMGAVKNDNSSKNTNSKIVNNSYNNNVKANYNKIVNTNNLDESKEINTNNPIFFI
jgi:hypothetical protein